MLADILLLRRNRRDNRVQSEARALFSRGLAHEILSPRMRLLQRGNQLARARLRGATGWRTIPDGDLQCGARELEFASSGWLMQFGQGYLMQD
jgi:hypothetical protein